MRFQHTIIRFDWILLLAALALTAVGLVVIYGIGASQPESDLFLFQKQFAGAGIGLAIILLFIFIDYRHVRGLTLPIYAVGAALLAGVLFFGSTIRGTRGWYVIGGLSFQPVEIAKLCLVLFLAAYLVRYVHQSVPRHAIAGSFLAAAAYAALVLFQPDLGSAVVMLLIWAFMILFVGLSLRSLVAMALIAVIAGVFSWAFLLQPYQKERFRAFIDPSLDERGAGYNVTQARIAIGSGGLFGKGIGEGSQSRLRFLPEAATDFVFAVIGEEMGFVGITFVLALFLLLFHRLFRIAVQAEDDFASLALFGIGTVFLIHVAVNAGMNLGLMPVTGIPLPFLSSASSFLITAFLAVAVAESVAVHRRVNA
jgi:rod shape determining protein RodA